MSEKLDKIEKLVIRMSDKEYANELKADIVSAGVPKKDIRTRTNKNKNECILTLYNANDNLTTVINMFRNNEYGLSLEEIQELLHIQLVLS